MEVWKWPVKGGALLYKGVGRQHRVVLVWRALVFRGSSKRRLGPLDHQIGRPSATQGSNNLITEMIRALLCFAVLCCGGSECAAGGKRCGDAGYGRARRTHARMQCRAASHRINSVLALHLAGGRGRTRTRGRGARRGTREGLRVARRGAHAASNHLIYTAHLMMLVLRTVRKTEYGSR